MSAHKINVKFFVEEESLVDLPALIPVFHRWIREQVLVGQPIDVADYKHVRHGPGIMLLGHEGDYALDLGNGRPGLWYSHKREWVSESLHERLQWVFELGLRASQLLEDEPNLALSFRTDEVEVTFADRLRFPNKGEAVAEATAIVTKLFEQFGLAVSVAQTYRDSREPLTLTLTLPEPPTVTEWLQRAGKTAALAFHP